MTGGYRVLLSCASSMVREELFEPGIHHFEEAEATARRIEMASHGIQAYVLPAETDPRQALHEKGWT